MIFQDETEEECGVNECERHNGGCQHICEDTREGYNCKCRDGFKSVGQYNCQGKIENK